MTSRKDLEPRSFGVISGVVIFHVALHRERID